MRDSFKTRQSLAVGSQSYEIYSLPALEGRDLGRLPFSLKILLENLLRHEDGVIVTREDVEALLALGRQGGPEHEIAFMPARVLLQDFTGVPVRGRPRRHARGDARLGGDPDEINPLQPVDLVIDHSVQVDEFGAADSLRKNNATSSSSATASATRSCAGARQAFSNFRVVPPDTGICHQVNLEYLARGRVRRRHERQAARLSRHAGRHRLAHDDGQRPRRARLGRGRHRGRGRDARPAASRC